MTTPEMTPAQQQIFELCERGLTPLAIADQLGMLERAVKAQITRIQTKLKTNIQKEERHERAVHMRQAKQNKVVPTSAENVADVVHEAAKAGPAIDIPEALQKVGERAAADRDIHPMILLGVTIQFVKLVGSRIAAHQLIEDVYDALRSMVGDGEPPTEGATSPWPRNLEVEYAEMRQRAMSLEQELSDLRKAVHFCSKLPTAPTA